MQKYGGIINRVAPGSSPIKVGLIRCDSTKAVVGESPLAQALAGGIPGGCQALRKLAKVKMPKHCYSKRRPAVAGFPKLPMGAQNVA